MENRFSLMSLSKVDRFMSNQDQNDHRPILHIWSNTFHQRICLVLYYLSVIMRESRMSQRLPGCVPSCYPIAMLLLCRIWSPPINTSRRTATTGSRATVRCPKTNHARESGPCSMYVITNSCYQRTDALFTLILTDVSVTQRYGDGLMT